MLEVQQLLRVEHMSQHHTDELLDVQLPLPQLMRLEPLELKNHVVRTRNELLNTLLERMARRDDVLVTHVLVLDLACISYFS